jgi:hypothetical protein
MKFRYPLLAILIAAAAASPAAAQCILANPSFEMQGSGGQLFSGWNQFGNTTATTVADHGSLAARVVGPDTGLWALSAFWQPQDCEPGERWEATGRVQHDSGQPLTGECAAIVNIEWRNAAEELIDFETFVVATASTPEDEYLEFSVVSNPAPAGTASTRLLLAVLQSPVDPAPVVRYDTVTFFSQGPPSIDDVQWIDFPGGRTLNFAGRQWRVKGPGYYGPGPNLFCDDGDCVWVDVEGQLNLTLQTRFGSWYSTEVVLEEALGYGDYVFTTKGRLDLIDVQAVLGIFIWQYGPCWNPGYLWWNPYNEIDIEYSRWGNPSAEIGQFVAQPYDYPGNLERFDYTFAEEEIVSHAFRWLPDRVEGRVWRGGPDDESPSTLIHAVTYTGPHIPRPEQPRVHLNLWKLSGTPAVDQQVVFTDFNFTPEGGSTSISERPGSPVAPRPAGRLHPARPNPFNPSTTLVFELERGARAELAIYDIAGRHVRTLATGYHGDGRHEVVWDGSDDSGRRVSSGVYFVRLRGEDFVETRRVALVK